MYGKKETGYLKTIEEQKFQLNQFKQHQRSQMATKENGFYFYLTKYFMSNYY
jgi:hypothetical protein